MRCKQNFFPDRSSFKGLWVRVFFERTVENDIKGDRALDEVHRVDVASGVGVVGIYILMFFFLADQPLH